MVEEKNIAAFIFECKCQTRAPRARQNNGQHVQTWRCRAPWGLSNLTSMAKQMIAMTRLLCSTALSDTGPGAPKPDPTQRPCRELPDLAREFPKPVRWLSGGSHTPPLSNPGVPGIPAPEQQNPCACSRSAAWKSRARSTNDPGPGSGKDWAETPGPGPGIVGNISMLCDVAVHDELPAPKNMSAKLVNAMVKIALVFGCRKSKHQQITVET